MRRRLFLGLPVFASACSLVRRRRPVAPEPVHYVVGEPYQIGGLWRYPRAQFDYDETGLAEVSGPHGSLCTDGVPYDSTALIGAHRTLQLPCVVMVTNFETGRQIAVRLEDRGPASPARLLAMTPRAFALLGPGGTPGVLQVRVQVQEAQSWALMTALGRETAPMLTIAAAPSGAVRSESLAPPPGVMAGPGGTGAGPALPRPAAMMPSEPDVPLRLPEIVTQVAVQPGRLFVDLGAFGSPKYAQFLAGRLAGLGAAASTSYTGRSDRAFRVRIGPLALVAEADAMLDRVLQAGVVDARIIVDQG